MRLGTEAGPARSTQSSEAKTDNGHEKFQRWRCEELTTEEVAVKRGINQGVDVGHINNKSVLGSE